MAISAIHGSSVCRLPDIANRLANGNTLCMTASNGDTGDREDASPDTDGIPADTFANRLLLSRAYAGHLSIREAADLCGYGRGAWTNWERGARPVDVLEVARVISDKMKIDHDWLLFGGPLVSGRGRPVKRSRMANTRQFRRLAKKPTGAHPNGPRNTPTPAMHPPTGPTTRRARRIGQLSADGASQAVA